MLIPIIWLLVFCASYFSQLYVMDKPQYFKSLSTSPRKASVYDLPEKASRIDIDRYIKEHIVPAELYFSMRRDYDAAEDSTDCLISLFMKVAPVVFLLRAVFKWLSEEKKATVILACAGVIAFCVVLAFTIKKLYSKFFAVPSLSNSYHDPVKYVEGIEDEFAVGNQKCCENNMTLIYFNYCCNIEKTMRKRIALKSIVSGVCAIIYLLVFFRNPYE